MKILPKWYTFQVETGPFFNYYIHRCISGQEGFAVVPDFLCKQGFEDGTLQLVWEGKVSMQNTLYFAQRKKTIYQKEITILENIFRKKLPDLNA